MGLLHCWQILYHLSNRGSPKSGFKQVQKGCFTLVHINILEHTLDPSRSHSITEANLEMLMAAREGRISCHILSHAAQQRKPQVQHFQSQQNMASVLKPHTAMPRITMSKIPMCGTLARKEKRHPPKNSSPLSFSLAEQHCWTTHHPGNLTGGFLILSLSIKEKGFLPLSFFLEFI